MSLKDRKTTGAPKPERRDAPVRRVNRNRREQEANRIVLLATAVIAVVIAVIVGGALLVDNVIKPAAAVVSVGGTNISTGDFQRRVVYQRWRDGNLLAQYYNNYGQYGQQLLGDSSGAIGQLYSAMQSPILYGKRVLDQMTDETVIAQYAKEKGITVSDAELQESAGQAFGYVPDPKTATPTVTPSITPTLLVSATPSPIPSLTPTVTPLPAGSPTPTATLVPTLTSTPFPTGIPTVTPGATEQKQNFDKSLTDYNKSAAKLTGLSESDIAAQFREENYRTKLREKVREQIGGKLEPVQEQNKVRHILVATEDEAKQVIDALNKGESFAALAKAVSTDTGSGAQGGELGWAAHGKYVKEFEEYVWKPASDVIGKVSDPIKSQFGYHIIQVETRESRPLTESEQQDVQNRKFNDWLTQAKLDRKATTYPSWSDAVPERPGLADFGVPTTLGGGGAGASPFG